VCFVEVALKPKNTYFLSVVMAVDCGESYSRSHPVLILLFTGLT
jgi:hypothetical protein